MNGQGFQNVGFQYGETPALGNSVSADSSEKNAPGTFTKTNLDCSSPCKYFRTYANAGGNYQYRAVLPTSSESGGTLTLHSSAATGINEAGATLKGYEINNTEMDF